MKAAVLWLGALGCAHTAARAPVCLQLVGTNDLHGHVSSEKISAGDLKAERGGLAGFGGYLDILRRRYGDQVMLLDSGDLFQGTLVSNASRGAAVIAAYNALGYQASAVGNHEFDFGSEGDDHDLRGSLRARIGEAKFPFLACNLIETRTGRIPEWGNLYPSRIIKVHGVRVGVIGVMTKQTLTTTTAANVKGLEVRPPAWCVETEARRLESMGVDLKVVVAHLGGACEQTDNPFDLSSCLEDTEVMEMLRQMPARTVDVVMAGHVHNYMAQDVHGTAVVEAGHYGESFSWVEACVQPRGPPQLHIHPPTDICVQSFAEGGCSERQSASAVAPATFLGEPVVADAHVADVLAPYFERVKQRSSEATGVTVGSPLPRIKETESVLGSYVAEGIRRASPGAQIGFSNAGGIRAGLEKGPVTFGQMFEVLPFDNRVVTLRLDGRQLRDFVLAPTLAGHGFPQLSGAHAVAERDGIQLFLDDGTPVKDRAIYVLATNDFLAGGGDGTLAVVSTLTPAQRRDDEVLVRDAVLNYLQSLPQPVKGQ